VDALTDNAVRAAEAPKLERSGLVRLATVLFGLLAVAALFFIAAGTLDVPRAWVYYGSLAGYLLVATGAMLVLIPGTAEVVNERGKMKGDVKAWDKMVGLAYTVLMLVSPVVAGLDAGRFHWSEVPTYFVLPAVAVTLLSYAFVHWAMIVNTHAETGVRIQQDRHHEVVSSGPYRFVRHPFYISIIITNLVYPLAVGSLYAYIPGLAIVALFVWRTAREDDLLKAELPGYADYTTRTRYRLVPGVW
jgi:protein-S-isoprenylcysteine O-methyltransferase Ste14